MDARTLCTLHGFPSFIDVRFIRPRQPGNNWHFRIRTTRRRIAHFERNSSDSFKIIGRGGGKPSFDNIHAETGEVMRHFQLLGRGHCRAGRLFAIAQGGIKNFHIVGHTFFSWSFASSLHRQRTTTCLLDYSFQFSGRSERTAAPARHISESRMAASSLSSFSR